VAELWVLLSQSVPLTDQGIWAVRWQNCARNVHHVHVRRLAELHVRSLGP
jgi:hypothetical protein